MEISSIETKTIRPKGKAKLTCSASLLLVDLSDYTRRHVMFCSLHDVRLSESKRSDVRPCFTLSAIFFVLFFGSGPLEDMGSPLVATVMHAVAEISFVLFPLFFAISPVVWFFTRRRTTIIELPSTKREKNLIEFYCPRGNSSHNEDFLKHVTNSELANRRSTEDQERTVNWLTRKPVGYTIDMVLTSAFLSSVLLLLIVLLTNASWHLLILSILPPSYYCFTAIQQYISMKRTPKLYREALKNYGAGRDELAVSNLKELAENELDDSVAGFLIRAHLSLLDFDEAFRFISLNRESITADASSVYDEVRLLETLHSE